jgi:hypothetical protein
MATSFSADLTFTSGSGSTGVSMDVSLGQTAPGTPPLTIQLQRVGSRVNVYNDLGANARYMDVSTSKQQKIQNAFEQLKALALPGVDNASFNHSKMTVWYEDRAGRVHVEDLQEIIASDPQIRVAFEALDSLVRDVWKGPLRGQLVQAGSKSSASGTKAMQRKNNDTLMAMPKSKFTETAKLAVKLYEQKEGDVSKQQAALRRMAAAERIIAPQRKLIADEIAKLKPPIAILPLTQADQAALDMLNKLYHKLSVDRLALYTALAFVPQPVNSDPRKALDEAKKAADDARKELQEYFNDLRDAMMYKNVNRNLPEFLRFIRGSKIDIPDNQVYSVDASALIFSSLSIPLARQGALDHWSKHRTEQKIDAIEDDLVRFLLTGQERLPILEKLIGQVADATLQAAMRAALTQSKTDARAVLNSTVALVGADNDAKIDQLKADNAAYHFE